jgi:hypothetical protein
MGRPPASAGPQAARAGAMAAKLAALSGGRLIAAVCALAREERKDDTQRAAEASAVSLRVAQREIRRRLRGGATLALAAWRAADQAAAARREKDERWAERLGALRPWLRAAKEDWIQGAERRDGAAERLALEARRGFWARALEGDGQELEPVRAEASWWLALDEEILASGLEERAFGLGPGGAWPDDQVWRWIEALDLGEAQRHAEGARVRWEGFALANARGEDNELGLGAEEIGERLAALRDARSKLNPLEQARARGRALALCARQGRMEGIEWALSPRGGWALVAIKKGSVEIALEEAGAFGREAAMERLLAEQVDWERCWALGLALLHGQDAAAERLLLAGAPVDQPATRGARLEPLCGAICYAEGFMPSAALSWMRRLHGLGAPLRGVAGAGAPLSAALESQSAKPFEELREMGGVEPGDWRKIKEACGWSESGEGSVSLGPGRSWDLEKVSLLGDELRAQEERDAISLAARHEEDRPAGASPAKRI